MRRVLLLVSVVCLAVATGKAQDPVKVDPNNWKVEFENDQVRVLRVHFPAHGKFGMHEHPANVLIPLTDFHVKDIFPDGKTAEVHGKAGQATWRDAVKHANENLGDTATESILVELKAKPTAAKPAAIWSNRDYSISPVTENPSKESLKDKGAIVGTIYLHREIGALRSLRAGTVYALRLRMIGENWRAEFIDSTGAVASTVKADTMEFKGSPLSGPRVYAVPAFESKRGSFVLLWCWDNFCCSLSLPPQ